MSHVAMPSRRGFTLIELLIVVAIIAILAAIAVPNFLEAQTRAKVTRVKSDMRVIATAMEAYLVDNNRYVNDSDNTLGKNGEDGLARLTTPIAYMTTLATDPFQAQVSGSQQSNPNGSYARYFELGSGSDHQGWGAKYGPQGAEPRINSWIVISVGTDASPIAAADDTTNNDEWPWGKNGAPCSVLTYDPTNGTVSDGDIVRAGGTLNTGNYFVNGVKFGGFPN